MKKFLIYSLLAALFCPAVVSAEAKEKSNPKPGSAPWFAGEVKVTGTTLEERGDSLFMDLDIWVHAKAMNDRQSWTIVPRLETEPGGPAIAFPRLLVNGKIKSQLYRRQLKYRNGALLADLPYKLVDAAPLVDTVLKYSMQVPYQLWMDSAQLNVYQILVSDAGSEQLFVVKNAGRVRLQPRAPYQAAPRVNFITPEKAPKSRRMQGQAFLDFQVGRSVIIPTFRRNPEELAKIDDAINKVNSDPDVRITGLFIEGYASPEAPYTLNDRLSRERAQALKEYIRVKFNLDESLFRVSSVAEDWDGLRALVAESSIPQKERIFAIIDSDEDYDRKEQRLKGLGVVYSRVMLTEMFPQLRRVEYQIDFTVKDYSVEEAQALLSKNPEQLSQRELFLVAQTHPAGSPQRDEIFDLIFRLYPDDATANINSAAAMLNRGEETSAKRYLDKAGDDPRAWNNLGVYYLMTGDLDRAQSYFERAAAQGVEEAAHNLGEVQRKRDDNKAMERYNRRE